MTKLLLDTHSWLWWLLDAPELSARAKAAIADPGNEFFVSAASACEIATKQRLGKLSGVPQALERWAELAALDGFVQLPVDYRHALLAGSYAQEHRDPFDRMPATQSEIEGLTLVTLDPAFALFGTATVW